jgi:hypothetical protein
VSLRWGIRNLSAKINPASKPFKSATSKEITEGYGFQFGRRLSSFMNPCSLSDGHLPKLQEMTLQKISSAVVTETQEAMA